MQAVLISIHPKWCELIASGEKTVEVRKTRPKLETPFKVYIYETQGRTETPFVDEEGHHIFKGRGQVIGEFVCDQIDYIGWISTPAKLDWKNYYDKKSCLTSSQLYDYSNGGCYYEWHISDLVIYDKPKELSEFKQVRAIRGYHKKCELKTDGINIPRLLNSSRVEANYLTRPPQSWCYVEEVSNDQRD